MKGKARSTWGDKCGEQKELRESDVSWVANELLVKRKPYVRCSCGQKQLKNKAP